MSNEDTKSFASGSGSDWESMTGDPRIEVGSFVVFPSAHRRSEAFVESLPIGFFGYSECGGMVGVVDSKYNHSSRVKFIDDRDIVVFGHCATRDLELFGRTKQDFLRIAKDVVEGKLLGCIENVMCEKGFRDGEIASVNSWAKRAGVTKPCGGSFGIDNEKVSVLLNSFNRIMKNAGKAEDEMTYCKGSGSTWEDLQGDPGIQPGCQVVVPSEFRKNGNQQVESGDIQKYAGTVGTVHEYGNAASFFNLLGFRFATVLFSDGSYQSYPVRDLVLFDEGKKRAVSYLCDCLDWYYDTSKAHFDLNEFLNGDHEWLVRCGLVTQQSGKLDRWVVNKEQVEKIYKSFEHKKAEEGVKTKKDFFDGSGSLHVDGSWDERIIIGSEVVAPTVSECDGVVGWSSKLRKPYGGCVGTVSEVCGEDSELAEVEFSNRGKCIYSRSSLTLYDEKKKSAIEFIRDNVGDVLFRNSSDHCKLSRDLGFDLDWFFRVGILEKGNHMEFVVNKQRLADFPTWKSLNHGDLLNLTGSSSNGHVYMDNTIAIYPELNQHENRMQRGSSPVKTSVVHLGSDDADHSVHYKMLKGVSGGQTMYGSRGSVSVVLASDSVSAKVNQHIEDVEKVLDAAVLLKDWNRVRAAFKARMMILLSQTRDAPCGLRAGVELTLSIASQFDGPCPYLSHNLRMQMQGNSRYLLLDSVVLQACEEQIAVLNRTAAVEDAPTTAPERSQKHRFATYDGVWEDGAAESLADDNAARRHRWGMSSEGELNEKH